MSSSGPNFASLLPALFRENGADIDLEAQASLIDKSVESSAGNSTNVQSSLETRLPRCESVSSLTIPIEMQSGIRPGDKEADMDNKPSMPKEALPMNMVEEGFEVQGQTASVKSVLETIPDGDDDGGHEPNAEVSTRGAYQQFGTLIYSSEQQQLPWKQEPETIIKDEMQGVWSDCANKLWGYQDEIINRWKDELNNLLIFAGLFSAVLTAFVIEYYPTLQPSTTPDTTTQLLMIMSAQLEVLTTGARHDNSSLLSVSALASSSSASKPSSQVVAVNGLWFAALVFSLGAASLAMSVNQWLNHHRTRPLSMSRESAEIWYLRHRSLDRWKVPLIISVLPVLLQVSLALFLVGLVVLLWPLNTSISAVVCVLVSMLLLGNIGSALIPAIVPECAHKSPQAWWWLKLLCGPQKLVCSAGHKLTYRLLVGGWPDGSQKISFGQWRAYLRQRKAPLKQLVDFLKQCKTSFGPAEDCPSYNVTITWLLDIFRGRSIVAQDLWNAGDWRACEVVSLKRRSSSLTLQGQVLAEAYTMISDRSFIIPVSMLCFDTRDGGTVLNSLTILSKRMQFEVSLGHIWGEYYATRASEEEKRRVIAMLDRLIDMLVMIPGHGLGAEQQWKAVNDNINDLIISMNDWRIAQDRLRRWWHSMQASTWNKATPSAFTYVSRTGFAFETELDSTDLEFLLSAFLSFQKGDFDRYGLLRYSQRFLNLARRRKWLHLGSIRDDLRRLVAIVYDDLNTAVLLSQTSSTNILIISEEYRFAEFTAECTHHFKEKSGIFDVTGDMLAFFVDLACTCNIFYWDYYMKEVGKMREHVDLPKETLHDIDTLLSSSPDQKSAIKERARARLRASCVPPADIIYVENGEASNS
ncbi:uncharacterized protein FIBRA_03005 [Fibroporia radiculosa]|uniref:DUF6535 domain-containing protein n=1 Tax=Fibroporia radiculosa TaxID=599839 RepID=J4HVR2_9APHY|nr:uncharacterized protein FIBRA_03005 [Fibroporia radiculosa]CCM00957.1 predicted protein [Fibroporia radiculosa]